MHGELFDSTIPSGEPELLKTTAYQRYLEELDGDSHPDGPSTRLAQLSPSLQADLGRFEQRGDSFRSRRTIGICGIFC